MPTVAAASAGASLMPSPMNSVGRPRGLGAGDGDLVFGALAGVDFGDPDVLGEVPHLRLAVA